MSVIVIAIGGGTASGKTTVANEVLGETQKVGKVSMIRLDDYYKYHPELDFNQRAALNYDHPDSIDWDLLLNHLQDLKNGITIQKPIYDFTDHQRSQKTEIVEPSHVIILEGILALAEERIRNLADIKLYVDTADDLRFIRRLTRDINARGRTVDSVIHQYFETVRPMHIQFVEPSKRYADLIIPNGGKNPIVVDFISTKICSIIKE